MTSSPRVVPANSDAYDGWAEAYAQENETNLFNAYYERPAMLGLAGDVDGQRVLDVGCGTGALAAALVSRGASVAGFDASSAMVELARRRAGDAADLRVADLAQPLPFPDDEFDLVVASLVLHYVKDWDAPLRELRRVLQPGGRLLVSVIHPTVYAVVYPEADYFALTQYSEDYVMAGRTVWLTYWHRPLHAVTDAFGAAGFRLVRLSEPPPAEGTPAELLPAETGARPFLCFLFLVLEAA